MKNHKYRLQKYLGKTSRHACPKCGRRYCFTLYIDSAGHPLHPTVGRCDHESSCGYHLTPREYFRQCPSSDTFISAVPQPVLTHRDKAPCTIPESILQKTLHPDIHSDFTTFLCSIFPKDTVEGLIRRYRLGVTKSRHVIYYQIDRRGGIRTGKIMQYDSTTGKRIKAENTPGRIDWVHSVLKRSGHLPAEWELTQCLFGEHLLSEPQEQNKTVALVESEKSAVIASAIMPEYIWLATGGKSQLKAEKLATLRGRNIIAFPDVDAFAEWTAKLHHLPGLHITVSDLLEKKATDEERSAHIDIADWLIAWKKGRDGTEEDIEEDTKVDK